MPADAVSEAQRPQLELLLYGLQSAINIGMILRVAETYEFRVSIYDEHRVLDDSTKLATISDFACGAMTRWGFHTIKAKAEMTDMCRGRRLIATSIERTAISLADHRFESGDVCVLGNEYDGLSDDFLRQADLLLTIPMPQVWTPKPKSLKPIDPTRNRAVARDGQPNLNVAISAGIICYAAFADGLKREPSLPAVHPR
jgi:tRNA G18 (ribose-2'-O)-methylase SpoU